ncbi:MAG: hypothetical protein KatS3mg057_2253 [Herpetosiphonaceae bacterium]|nr:MAG: hypothetical protein KatS3mg057_2253 [Herpetosiphonaceae bacterium]
MPQANDVLATASAIETAAAVRNSTVSVVETTEAAIARIEALDGPINAVVVRDFAQARDQAKLVDAAVAKRAPLPLAGVSMTLKDVFDVAGLPPTFDLEFARTYRPTDDAPTIRRLKDAGVVMLGKTNVAHGRTDYQNDNPVYGRTNTLHNLASSLAGSSGGSAAVLVAAEGWGAPVVIGVMSIGGWR